MTLKITLITPPDFYENENQSILFMHLNEQDQEIVSKWLSNSTVNQHLNFYLYSGEVDIKWLLHAVAISTHKFIDLNYANKVSETLASYLLAKNNFYYKLDDVNLTQIYNMVNTNRVSNIEDFLIKVFGE